MTLENLKDYFKDLSLKHKDVKEFQVGNDYDTGVYNNTKFPLVFYEMPYSINMNIQKPVDTIQFAFAVYLNTKLDDISDSHQAISLAKAIGDAILMKALGDQNSDFKITAVNSISVREYSDDYVSGMRYDLTILLERDICNYDYESYFNEL
jgi:hypothetical protein